MHSEIHTKVPLGTKSGDSFLIEKGCMSFGSIDKAALTDERIAQELAGIKIPKDGKVYPVKMANTIKDRGADIIPQAVLNRFASNINSESFTLNFYHDRSYPIGKVLPKATVEMKGMDFELSGYMFVYDAAALPTKTTSANGISIQKAIEDEVVKDVSIEFRGRSKYIAPREGEDSGTWEYYIGPDDTNVTEFTGLALVPKGAQRGASVVKSLDGGKDKVIPKNKNMTEKLIGGGQRFTIEYKDDRIIGGDLIEKALDDMHKAKADAETAKAVAETALAAQKADSDAVRTALETDVINFSKLNGEEKKAEDLAKLTLKGLFDLHKTVMEKHDAPVAAQKSMEVFQPTESY